MANWISKAVGAFKREPVDVPQPFEILCECGLRHSGLRRQRFQCLLCKECGTSLFVLPRDVYPIPAIRLVREPVRQIPEVSDDAETEDELVVRPLDEEQPKKLFRPNSVPLPKPKLTKRQLAKQAEEERLAAEAARPSFKKFVRRVGTSLGNWASRWGSAIVRFWTPLRVIFAGLAAVVLLSFMLMISQVRSSRAVEVARDRGASGLQAFENRQWATAQADLALAAQAVDHLQREDAEAMRIRQAHLEVEALLNLSDVSLLDLLQLAAEDLDHGRKDSWKTSFSQRFRGKWLVFEGHVTAHPGNGPGKSTSFLSMPWTPSGEPAIVEANFPAMKKLLGNDSRQMIFAGQLEAVERQDGEWRVKLRPETGILWVNLLTYREIGLSRDVLRNEQDLEAQLSSQAAALGIAGK